VALEYSEL